MALAEDTKLWASKGSGKALNVKMACVLGRSMLSGIGANYLKVEPRRKAKREFLERYKDYFDFESEKETVGHLRFGHAESVLPLISLLCNAFLFVTVLSAKKNRLIYAFMAMLGSFTAWCCGSLFMRMTLEAFPR